jgi:hypothetical protein
MKKEKFVKISLLTKSLLELLDIYHLTRIIERNGICNATTAAGEIYLTSCETDLSLVGEEKWLTHREILSLMRKFSSIYDMACYAHSLHESNREKISYAIQVLNLLCSLDSTFVAKKSSDNIASASVDQSQQQQVDDFELIESVERATIIENSHLFRKLGENASYLESLRSLAYRQVGYLVANSVFQRYFEGELIFLVIY